MEKRWSKELQNEKDLRYRLQENLETIANQIHGLESEAQGRLRASSQSSKDFFPLRDVTGVVNLPLIPAGSVSSGLESQREEEGGEEEEEGEGEGKEKEEGEEVRRGEEVKSKKRNIKGDGEDSEEEEEEEEEEEKFFDARETSIEEWVKLTKAEFLGKQPDPAALPVTGAGIGELPPFGTKTTKMVGGGRRGGALYRDI